MSFVNRKNSDFCGMKIWVYELLVREEIEEIELRHVGGEAFDNDTFYQLRTKGKIGNRAIGTADVWIQSGFLSTNFLIQVSKKSNLFKTFAYFSACSHPPQTKIHQVVCHLCLHLCTNFGPLILIFV